MQVGKQEMVEFAEIVAQSVVKALNSQNYQNCNVGKQQSKQEKSAYSKTESLLYNYNGFKRIIKEREQEIEEIIKYGVPQTCGAGGERVQNGNLPHGIVLPEEFVESAVQKLKRSVQETVDAINLIDKCMAALKNDPYYRVLELRYFEGRTQEDIAILFGCSQVTISNNKNRLVRELSMRLFPNQSIQEMMN